MTKRAWRFALLWLVLIVIGVLGHLRLSFDTELIGLLPRDLPAVRGLELYQRHFAGKDEALITYTGTGEGDKEGDAAREGEKAAAAIAAELGKRPDLARGVTWRPPWQEHPEAAAELLAWFWLNRPPEEFAKLQARLDPAGAPAHLEEVVARMASSFSPTDLALTGWDPYGIADPALLAETGLLPADGGMGSGETGFTSADGRTRILYVHVPPEVDGAKASQRWYKELRALFDRMVKEGGKISGWAEVGFTGEPVFVAEISRQMESSLKMEIVGSMTVITILFLLLYRRIAPLLMMQLMFALTVFTTVGLGGWLIGRLNIINVGFAAMLVGLTVDYGIILYQESVQHPGLSSRKLRKVLGPSIWGSCCTTAVVFAAILTSHFPAIAQLGALVAIGMVAGALNALYVFAPAWLHWQRRHPARATPPLAVATRPGLPDIYPLLATPVLVLAAALALVLAGLPGFDTTPAALRPRKSQAYDTLDVVQAALSGQEAGKGLAGGDLEQKGNLLLVIEGKSPEEVQSRLAAVRAAMPPLDYTLPDALWPALPHQRANLAAAKSLAANLPALEAAAREAGFQEEALFLLRNACAYWAALGETAPGLPPETNPLSRWLMKRFASFRPADGEFVALGIAKSREARDAWVVTDALKGVPGVSVASWPFLGEQMVRLGLADVLRITPVLAVLLLVMLWLVFRGAREMILCAGSLALSLLLLLVAMRALGLHWNLMSILALPLLMGSAADYSIHTLVALKRLRGGEVTPEEGAAHLAGIRRALVFCGLCTIAGFASLAFSVSRGLSTLGLVCALGTLLNMLTAFFLLPAWWRGWERRSVSRTRNVVR